MSIPACCPPGSWPQLLRPNDELNKDDVPAPKGSIVTVKNSQGEDLPIYYVEPATKSLGSIMVIPDIYSVRVLVPSVRSGDRIGTICDALADKGYTVALPSIFRDKPIDVATKGPDDGDFLKFNAFAQDGAVDWFKSQNYDKVGPDIKACAELLKEKTGGQAIGVIGFCYGTWLLSKTSSMGDVDFACAVGCHPATKLEEAVFGQNELAMMESVKMPTRFLWAGNDSDIYINDGPGQKALEKTGGEVVRFDDQLHGWVSRGDVADPAVKAGVEKALELIFQWFADKMPKAE